MRKDLNLMYHLLGHLCNANIASSMMSCFVTWKLKTEDSKTFQQIFNGQFPCETYLRGNHSSCSPENKYSVQDYDPGDDEYNYYDSLQARLI